MGCFLPKFCNGVFSANLVLNGRALPSQRNKEEDREVVSGAGVVPVGAGQGMPQQWTMMWTRPLVCLNV